MIQRRTLPPHARAHRFDGMDSCPFPTDANWTIGEAIRNAALETEFVGATGPFQVSLQQVGFRMFLCAESALSDGYRDP